MCFSSLLHIRKSSSRRWFLTLWLVWKSVSGPRFSIPQGMWKLEEMSKYSFIQPFYSEIEIICMIVRCLSECHLQRKELKCMLDMLSCSAVTQRVKVVIFAHLAVTSLFLMSSFASYFSCLHLLPITPSSSRSFHSSRFGRALNHTQRFPASVCTAGAKSSLSAAAASTFKI